MIGERVFKFGATIRVTAQTSFATVVAVSRGRRTTVGNVRAVDPTDRPRNLRTRRVV